MIQNLSHLFVGVIILCRKVLMYVKLVSTLHSVPACHQS